MPFSEISPFEKISLNSKARPGGKEGGKIIPTVAVFFGVIEYFNQNVVKPTYLFWFRI